MMMMTAMMVMMMMMLMMMMMIKMFFFFSIIPGEKEGSGLSCADLEKRLGGKPKVMEILEREEEESEEEKEEETPEQRQKRLEFENRSVICRVIKLLIK